MRVDRITLKHFLSHPDTDLTLNGARLTTLVGANGAGKSSLLDAVSFVLYDAARARTDDLVQLGASEMSASVEFEYAGERYRAIRGRSTRAGGKSFLELAIADGDGWRPLTADSIRETQALIEQLLRMDAATFATAAWLMQGKASAFAEATAAERKRILSTVLGLDRYERAEDFTRGLVRDVYATAMTRREQREQLMERLADRPQVEATLSEARAAVNSAQAEGATVASALAEARGLLLQITEEHALAGAAVEDVRRATRQVDEAKVAYQAAERRRIDAVSRVVRADEILASKADVTQAKRLLPSIRRNLAAEEARATAHLDATEAYGELRSQLATAERDHERLAAKVALDYQLVANQVAQLEAQIDALEPVTCPECGATFAADPAGLAERVEASRQALAALPRTLDESPPLVELREAVSSAAEALGPAPDPSELARLRAALMAAEVVAGQADRMTEAQRAKTDATAAIAQAEKDRDVANAAGEAARAALDGAQVRLRGLDEIVARKRQTTSTVAHLEGRVTEIATTARAWEHAVTQAETLLEQMDADAAIVAELEAALDVAVLEERILQRLVTAFGVNGIPARIIESVLPELSRHANELLNQLRPGLALEIRAQRAKKSGDGVVEALDLIVSDDAGERPLALFSGGERMSVSLALAVGLSRLVARRAGTAIRTLVIDEPDGLDADARRAFGQALRVLAHAGELERVILVSHHPDLAEYGDAVYAVTKDAAGSHVGLVS